MQKLFAPTIYHFSPTVIWISLLISLFCGCATTTKPNTPLSGPYPYPLKELAVKNPLLAKELCRLPEIQDGISNGEKAALERLLETYTTHRESFNAVFHEMYLTGKPEIRKYCAPLQALLWVIQQNRYNDFKGLFENYSIEKLLDLSWDFKKEDLLTTKQIETVIQETKNAKIKADYLDTYKHYGASKVEKYLFFDFERKPSWFTFTAGKILKEAQRLKFEKWNDFNEVTERLNSPELIDYYEKRRIHYQLWSTIPGAAPNRLPDIRYVFKNSKGDCVYVSAFTVYCLKKAGYDAHIWYMPTPHGKNPWHAVTVYYDNGKKMVMDNGRPNPYKIGIVPYSVFERK